MKKFLSGLFAITLMCGLIGCGGDAADPAPSADPPAEPSEPAEGDAPAEPEAEPAAEPEGSEG